MSGFARERRTGVVIATFSAFEADVLRSLAAQLVELFGDERATTAHRDPLEDLLDFSGPTNTPEDPVLARLLPTAYADDEEAAADFRRFTESSLRRSKSDAASVIISTLDSAGHADGSTQPESIIDVELDSAAAHTWLRALTDLRLALGTRLGVAEDDEASWASLPEHDPRSQGHRIYEWLGYVQETLVMAVIERP